MCRKILVALVPAMLLRVVFLAPGEQLVAAENGNGACERQGNRHPGFDPERDGFAFANETHFVYESAEDGRISGRLREADEQSPVYSRHCFVMCRAALQFRRFVTFDPAARPVSNDEYRVLIRAVSRIPVWSKRGRTVTMPGFSDLRSFSLAHPQLLQEEMGAWWPTYFRIGNWRMSLPPPPASRRQLAADLSERLARGEAVALYLTRGLSLNHCVIAYQVETRKRSAAHAAPADAAPDPDPTPYRPGHDLEFTYWDPNLPGSRQKLTYDAISRNFHIPASFYFRGGMVTPRRVYLSPFH